MEDKKKINLGFDIGITSVGWSIIDEDYKILDMGVRLFDDPASPDNGKLKNDERRKMRHSRRRIRRIRYRKDKLINLFIKYNLSSSKEEIYKVLNLPLQKLNPDFKTVIDIKVKGLKNKLSTEEIIKVLFHYISRRGYFIYDLSKNMNDNTNLNYPSEQIKMFYDENEWYKNYELMQTIKHERYLDEVKQILQNQNLSKEFKDEYIKIFSSRRSYSDGPGSKNSPTEYGKFFMQNGNIIEKENIWIDKIGFCKAYPENVREAKHAPISEIFGLINQINNLYIYDINNDTNIKVKNQITKELLKKLPIFDSNEKIKNLSILDLLSNLLWNNKYNSSLSIIKGYPRKKSGEENFQKLDVFFKTIKFLIKTKIIKKDSSLDILNLDFIKLNNSIFEKVRIYYPDLNKIVSEIKKDDVFDKLTFEDIKKYAIQIKKYLNGTNELSYKAMEEYINNFNNINTFNSSADEYFYYKYCDNRLNEINKYTSKYINKKIFSNLQLSLTAKRAINQSIDVMNKIIKIYLNGKNSGKYELSNITIELARDKNTFSQRKRINDEQKQNEKLINDILEDKNVNIKSDSLSNNTKMCLKLLREQDYKDIYSDDFDLIDVKYFIRSLENSTNEFQIEHIIPLSISCDNSMENKVITRNINNKLKKQKTPYQWMSTNQWNIFKNRIQTLLNLSWKKKEKLLYLGDPRNDQLGFINRNIVDTRISSKYFFSLLKMFFDKNNDIYPNTNINVIYGQLTSYARNNLFRNKLIKNREDNYYHHAVDATIICLLGMSKFLRNINERSFIHDKLNNIYKANSTENGNDINISFENKEFLSNERDFIFEQIKQYIENNKIKYSRMKEKITNMKLMNSTILSSSRNVINNGKNTELKCNIIKNYGIFDIDAEKYFSADAKEEDLQKLLIYNQNDNDIFNQLKKIYLEFSSKTNNKNPFLEYMKTKSLLDGKYNKDFRYLVTEKNQIIKKLKVIAHQKNINDVFYIKNNNNKGILDNFNWKEIKLYKDINNNIVPIIINSKLLKSNGKEVIIDFKKLELKLAELKIKKDNNSKYRYKDWYGEFLKIEKDDNFFDKDNKKEIYYVVGFTGSRDKTNKLVYSIELKPIFKPNPSGKHGKKVSLNVFLKKYSKVNVDVLGNFC